MLNSKRCRGRDNFAPNRRQGEAVACLTTLRRIGAPQWSAADTPARSSVYNLGMIHI